jgi:hypothetical protein
VQKSKVFLFINTLTESSEPVQAASSSTTPKAGLVKLELLVKQELIKNPYGPSAVCRCNIVATFAVEPTPFATLPNTKPLPIIPSTHSNVMSNPPYRMPVRGTDHAPKFNGQPLQLHDFLETFEMHTDDVNLQGNDRVKYLLHYLNSEDRELWSGIPEVQSSDYNVFINLVKDMYPGWEGTRHYTVADLQGVAQKYVSKPMTWRDKFSEYVRVFNKVVQSLTAKKVIGKSEHNCIFLEGFPSDFQTQMRTGLMIKFPDHHPLDPYPMKDVTATALFLMPESPPLMWSASITINVPLANLLPKSVQQPTQGTVTKCKYSHPTTTPIEGCIFCSAADHYITRCQEQAKYLEAGKCKLDGLNRLILNNGNHIFGQEHTLKEKIDHFLKSDKNSEPAQSMQAGLWVRASPEVECVLEVNPSACVHTVVESESEIDEDEHELESIMRALVLAKAKVDQKHKSSVKSKSVHFDGVEVPSDACT